MAGDKLARELVLSGVALIVVFGVPLFPLAVTCAVVELGAIRSGYPWALARLAYFLAVIGVAVAGWMKGSVKLALTFLAMLIGAVCAAIWVNCYSAQ